jgi:hypothetical protein
MINKKIDSTETDTLLPLYLFVMGIQFCSTIRTLAAYGCKGFGFSP